MRVQSRRSMQAGSRTSSNRPGSGGRSTFKVPPDLGWISFRRKGARGPSLELRAGSTNLQDTLPGTVYTVKDKKTGKVEGPYTQQYANGKTHDEAPELHDNASELLVRFLVFWRRCSTDLEFLREQQALFAGDADQAVLSVSTVGGKGKGAKLRPHVGLPARLQRRSHRRGHPGATRVFAGWRALVAAYGHRVAGHSADPWLRWSVAVRSRQRCAVRNVRRLERACAARPQRGPAGGRGGGQARAGRQHGG